MALAGINRGTGGNTTSSTTFNINTSVIPVGSIAIVCIAYDNAGGGGADPYSTHSDASGNQWFWASTATNDPGVASAGISYKIFYTKHVALPLNLTITFGTAVVAKAYTLTELTTTGAGFNIGASATSIQTTASPTITTASINSGNFVIGAVAGEGNGTRTGDTDTTNGSWSTAQQTGFGTTTSGAEVISQFKVVTATGTQTYNPTLSVSDDLVIGWLEFSEIPLGTSFDPMGMMGFFGM